MNKPRGAQDWESWIDEQIRKAQEQGAFDNLPGKGKPLHLKQNPYARERELAFKVLKDAGYAPDWIEIDKAIRGKLEKARGVLARSWARYNARLNELGDAPDRWSRAERERVQAGWREAVAAFEEEVAGINQEIADLNLKVPSPRFQRLKVIAADEVERLKRDRNE